MKEEYVLELENIRKEYPGVVALKDVTLRLKKGDKDLLGSRSTDIRQN